MEYASTFRIPSETCKDVTFVLHKPSYGRLLEFDRLNANFREEVRKLSRRQAELQDELDAEREVWETEQDARLATLKQHPERAGAADAIRRIENGFEYLRLVELVRYAMDEEQRKELSEKIKAVAIDRDVFTAPRDITEGFRELREKSEELRAELYNKQRILWGLQSIEGLVIDGKEADVNMLIADGPYDLAREILAKVEEVNGMTPEQLKNSSLPSTSSVPADGSATATTVNAA